MPPQTRAAAARRCFNDLPDDLLRAILVAAGQGAGPRVTRVCKRWRALFFAAPELWRQVELLAPAGASKEALEAWAAAKQALLRRVGPLIERLALGPSADGTDVSCSLERGGVQIEALLALLQPLELQLWDEGPACNAGLLAGRTRLRSLLLHDAYMLSKASVAAVHGLALQLRSLELRACFIKEREWAAVLACTGLTRLSLRPFVVLDATGERATGALGDVSPLLALTRLAALHELSIYHRPAMYGIEEEEFYHEGAGTLEAPLPSAFPALRSYRLRLQAHEWYDWQWSVGGVRFVSCTLGTALEPGVEGPALQIERLACLGPSGTLAGALQALLPAGCRPSNLHLRHVAQGLLPAPALGGCPALARLQALLLWQSPLGEAGLAALLAAAPRLERLVTSASLPVAGQVPAAVRERPWERLSLQDEQLQELPPGPYLQGLTWLDLSRNQLTALPPALAGATALRGLDLEGNPLLLSEADAALMAALPALGRVELDHDRAFHSDKAVALLRPGFVVSQAPERRCQPESEGEHCSDDEGWSSGDEEP